MSTYPTLVAEIRSLRAAWRRSDDAYHEQPTVSCAAWRDLVDSNGKRIPCPNVVTRVGQTLCRGCRDHAAKVARAS